MHFIRILLPLFPLAAVYMPGIEVMHSTFGARLIVICYIKRKISLFSDMQKGADITPKFYERRLLTKNEPQYATAYCACENQKNKKRARFFLSGSSHIYNNVGICRKLTFAQVMYSPLARLGYILYLLFFLFDFLLFCVIDLSELTNAGCKVLDGAVNNVGRCHINTCNLKAVKR